MKKLFKNRKALSPVVAAMILIVVVIIVSVVVAVWMRLSTATPPEPSYLVSQKISDVTSEVYRVIDEDYGIVLYVVDTYGLASAPSISGIHIGEVKITPLDGVSQITKEGEIPAIYRLVDLEINTVSYIIDTHGLASSPSVVTFSLEE